MVLGVKCSLMVSLLIMSHGGPGGQVRVIRRVGGIGMRKLDTCRLSGFSGLFWLELNVKRKDECSWGEFASNSNF